MIWNKKKLILKLKNASDKEIFELKKISEKKNRSNKQVRYYWWVVIDIISKETWYMPFEVNEQNKSLFWKSTFTDLSTVEFEEIMSLLRQFYHYHLNYNIPKPNEVDFYYD